MGLLQVLRGGVKTAHKLTLGIQPTVQFSKAVESGDGAGGKDYPITVSLKAIVEDKQEIVRTISGELSQSKTHLTFLDANALSIATGGEGVKESDRIVLPSGETGPILALGGFIDAGTGLPLATEVWLG